MKKLLFVFAILFGFLTASARGTYSHDVKILPPTAQETLKQNFKADVSHIKIEKEFGRVREYDVVLTDGSEITFDKRGNWKEIEMCQSVSVPSGLLPHPIASYVKQNQKQANVSGIEKTNSGFDVELSNGKDMKFTPKGKFIRYDD